MFRLCVYQTLLLVFVFVVKRPDTYSPLEDIGDVGLIFALPIVWVWRKPLLKLVKQALGFLNKKAEEG